MQADTPINIAAGFKTCEVYPLDPSAIRVMSSVESLACQAHDQPSTSSLKDDHPSDTAIHDSSPQLNSSSALESESHHIHYISSRSLIAYS